MQNIQKLLARAVACCFICVSSSVVWATTIPLSVCETQYQSICPGNTVNVTTSENNSSTPNASTQLTITVTPTSDWGLFAAGIFDFNYSGGTINSILVNNPDVVADGSGTVDGFGKFIYKFKDDATNAGTISSLIFTINGTGLDLSGFGPTADSPHTFAAHVKYTGTAACPINTTSCTMFVSDDPGGGGAGTPAVPEPATFVTLGTALVSLPLLRRLRRS